MKINKFLTKIIKKYNKKTYSINMLILINKVINSRDYLYEPVKISGKMYESKRNWEDRWEIIKNELIKYNSKSVLDIGSSEGWFIRKASEELNCFTLGIDSSRSRVITGDLTRLYDNVEYTATMKGIVNIEKIKTFPKFDTIICLSVLHHIIRHEGVEEAGNLVYELSKKANNNLIFEVGTSEENKADWADAMPDYEYGQSIYYKHFFDNYGMKNIVEIGCTPSIYKDAKRIIFSCEPK